MAAVFADFDADGSGSITAHEFRVALKKMGVGLVNKHIDALIQAMDANHDGVIDLKEFVAFANHDAEAKASRVLAAGGHDTPPPGATHDGEAAVLCLASPRAAAHSSHADAALRC